MHDPGWMPTSENMTTTTLVNSGSGLVLEKVLNDRRNRLY
jgi:hypothetical protein